jgi:uncharacterized membrane protein
MTGEGFDMTSLMAAALAFLGIHLAVSGTRLRDIITGRIGENRYVPLFALASLGAVVWMCVAYNRVFASPGNIVLFDAGQGFRNLGLVVVGLALLIAVPGVLMGNPTSAGQGTARIRGVLRITRHPFLVGVLLWAGFHLVAAGSLASTILFGTFFVLALLGPFAIDRKVRRKRPADWQTISATTSIIPFAAILAGRGRFAASEYFDWRFSLAFLEVALILYFHSYLFSMSPYPGFWTGWSF